jgi:hypothetical protein
MQFLDERIAEYEHEASNMFKSLAEAAKESEPTDESDSLPPPPPQTRKRKSAKERANAEGKATLKDLMKFDLTLIPGIGYDTAAIIASELGSSLESFPTENHFASYLGLAPSLGKSAGKNVRQRRCKNTSRAGLALRMAASTLYKSSSELGAYFRNVADRSDRKTAVKATARRMAHMIYRGMKYGKEYIDIGEEAYQARIRDKKLKTVNKLIKSLNINASELMFQT